jgi:Rrf2 family protein
MRITTREEYSILTLLELAQNHDTDSISLKKISDSNNISPNYLAQIFMSLKTSGLVSSSSGSRGGYKLAKTPDQISLFDIIRAVSGEIKLSNCLSDPDYCLKANHCNFRVVLLNINNKITEILKSYTLEGILQIKIAENIE